MTETCLSSKPSRLPDVAAEDAAIDTLARTLWGEAADEPVRVKEALAAVILNRVREARADFGRGWLGATVVQACLGPDQFTCWRGTPNSRHRLLSVAADDPAFAICRRIAARAVRGALSDPTEGATHYHRLGEVPWWRRNMEPTAVIGRRRFYRRPRSRAIPAPIGASPLATGGGR